MTRFYSGMDPDFLYPHDGMVADRSHKIAEKIVNVSHKSGSGEGVDVEIFDETSKALSVFYGDSLYGENVAMDIMEHIAGAIRCAEDRGMERVARMFEDTGLKADDRVGLGVSVAAIRAMKSKPGRGAI